MASRPAPAGTGISTAISAPAANPGPLSPAQARASRLQVCACVAAASDSGVHVPRAVLVIRSARPHCMPLPLLHPAGFCVQRGSAARTTTASLGPGCHISRQPPWRPQYLTGTSVLREALKYVVCFCAIGFLAQVPTTMAMLSEDNSSHSIRPHLRQW